MIRASIVIVAGTVTLGAALAQQDRLAAAYDCLDRRLADAGRSNIPVVRLVSAALRACNLEVEDYLRGVERQAVLPSTTLGAPLPSAPAGRPSRSKPSDPKRAAREAARKELIARYEKRIAEERAKRKQ